LPKAKVKTTRKSSGMSMMFGTLTTLALIFFLWTLVMVSTASIPMIALALGTSIQ
jgi:hypothetical protein